MWKIRTQKTDGKISGEFVTFSLGERSVSPRIPPITVSFSAGASITSTADVN